METFTIEDINTVEESQVVAVLKDFMETEMSIRDRSDPSFPFKYSSTLLHIDI